MRSLSSFKKQKGFTIVELLIVIVIIGILATLVLVTFTGIQQKAHDTQRKTDIDAIQSHLEAYYAEHGSYPDLTMMNTSTWVAANMKGLDPTALVDPNGGTLAATATSNNYGYNATNSGNPCTESGTGTAMTADCNQYTLTAIMASDGSSFTKQSN